MSVALYLQGGYPVSMESGVITIGFAQAQKFNMEALDNQSHKQLIESAFKDVLGLDAKVKFVISDKSPAKSLEGTQPVEDRAVEEDIPDIDDAMPAMDREVDPIIKDALEMFGGELKDNGRGASR